MIDHFQVDGQDLAISHNAMQAVLQEKGRFTGVAAHLGEYKLHYYTHVADTLFMDDGKAVCLAAQIIAGWDQEASDEEYHVFVPGDAVVYHAQVSVNPQFTTVTAEQLLNFHEASGIMNEHRSHSLVHDSGKLAEQFRDLSIETTDLRLELFEDGLHTLRYGINRQQLMMLAALPVLGIIMVLAAGPLLDSITGMRQVPEVVQEVVQGPPPSRMPQRLQPDLASLAQIMNRQSLLALHGLGSLTITPAEDAFSIGAQGSLRPKSTVMRLANMAHARQAAFSFDGNAWSMNGTHPRLSHYEAPAPTDIYRQLDKWRLVATLHNVSLNFGSREALHDAVRYRLQLVMTAPHPVRLQMLIDDLDRQGISGELHSATLTPGVPDGQVWSEMALDYSITGVEP